jgi:tetratricopeptide (TPR) repeat protein
MWVESGHGWGNILHFALVEAEAWTMFSEGKHREAVTRLRESESYERDHPMYYADILPRPAEEMLGDMLLAMERPEEALAAYEEALKIAPKRLDSLMGAGEAAKRCGNHTTSAQFFKEIKDEGAQVRVGTG